MKKLLYAALCACCLIGNNSAAAADDIEMADNPSVRTVAPAISHTHDREIEKTDIPSVNPDLATVTASLPATEDILALTVPEDTIALSGQVLTPWYKKWYKNKKAIVCTIVTIGAVAIVGLASHLMSSHDEEGVNPMQGSSVAPTNAQTVTPTVISTIVSTIASTLQPTSLPSAIPTSAPSLSFMELCMKYIHTKFPSVRKQESFDNIGFNEHIAAFAPILRDPKTGKYVYPEGYYYGCNVFSDANMRLNYTQNGVIYSLSGWDVMCCQLVTARSLPQLNEPNLHAQPLRMWGGYGSTHHGISGNWNCTDIDLDTRNNPADKIGCLSTFLVSRLEQSYVSNTPQPVFLVPPYTNSPVSTAPASNTLVPVSSSPTAFIRNCTFYYEYLREHPLVYSVLRGKTCTLLQSVALQLESSIILNETDFRTFWPAIQQLDMVGLNINNIPMSNFTVASFAPILANWNRLGAFTWVLPQPIDSNTSSILGSYLPASLETFVFGNVTDKESAISLLSNWKNKTLLRTLFLNITDIDDAGIQSLIPYFQEMPSLRVLGLERNLTPKTCSAIRDVLASAVYVHCTTTF